MRIKILMLGADPVSMMADAQLLRERDFLVLTTFNPQNVNELVSEVKPDVVFFDPDKPNNTVTDACNDFVNNYNIPVVLTLSDDDEYLVETGGKKDDRAIMTDNIIDAIKIALRGNTPTPKPTHKTRKQTATVKAGQLFV